MFPPSRNRCRDDDRVVEGVPASAQPRGPSIPAFCEVQATISPVAGSHIGAVYRLPVNWNGKVLGIGGGGFAGNLTIGAAAEGSRAAMRSSRTTGAREHGRARPEVRDHCAWKTECRSDRRLRAPCDTRRDRCRQKAGDQLLRPRAAAFVLAGMLHRRPAGARGDPAVPADYDGVIAGAARLHAARLLQRHPQGAGLSQDAGSNLLPEHVPLIQKHVLAACDGKDGIADGIITDPRSCTWDPGELAARARRRRTA